MGAGMKELKWGCQDAGESRVCLYGWVMKCDAFLIMDGRGKWEGEMWWVRDWIAVIASLCVPSLRVLLMIPGWFGWLALFNR